MTDDERMATVTRIQPIQPIQPQDVAARSWEPRAVARARGLSDLLVRRPELSGVYRPADVTAEAVLWSA